MEETEKEFFVDGKKPDYPKKDDYCVTINVYTKCGKCKDWKKDDYCHKDKKDKNCDHCVEINVYTDCE